MPFPVLSIWTCSILVQSGIFVLLFAKGHSRKLPVFTSYIALNLGQALFLYVLYIHSDWNAHTTSVLAWTSQALILPARALAVAEILRKVLEHYSGIWALSWRLLAVAYVLVVSYAVVEAGTDTHWILLILDRGFHLSSAVVLVLGLWLIAHYSVPVEPLYKSLLLGLGVYSCVVVVSNTIGQALFLARYPHYQDVWNFITVLAFLGVLLAWIAALRRPLPTLERKPNLLPVSVYGQLSPQINLRLRLLNEQLGQFWKVEARRP